MGITINTNPTIPALPRFEDKRKIDVRYMLIPPYASAHIFWDQKISEVVYEIEEPILQDYEKEILEQLEKAMTELININVAVENTIEATTEYIDKTARLLIDELNLRVSHETYGRMFYYLFRDFIGMNELDPLLRDYFIEDIECNGIETPVYVVHRLYRNLRTNLVYEDMDKLAGFVEKLAQRTGRYVSYAQPLLDGSLPDGSRVNATYTKDVTSRGPTFCFKDGNVQLNDGKVKNIKKLFEESKEKFGFKIENGNEIVKASSLSCCGVEETDLQQKDCQLKSIIKLKAPDKLVKIYFEDGGEIEVTLDHCFHVADSSSLKLTEAKNLKEGMLVPMPKKINVLGYRQKIDVYSLLKDFSYVKKICAVKTFQIKEIVSQEVGLYKAEKNFRQILSQQYGVGSSYFYEILNRGSSISFSVLDEMCKKKNIDFSQLGEISINIYGGGSKNKSKAIKVPGEIDEDLAYLAGALISDGHLSKEYIDYSCFEEGFKNSVKEKLLKIFGKFDSYYNDNRIYLCNLFAPFFFNKIFDIPIGKKSTNVKIPSIIFKSDNKVISFFIKGLFDGDGTVSAGLSYKTFSKELAEGLTYLLARLGIYSYFRKEAGGFRINIPSPYYKNYSNIISFDSIPKREGLKKLIEKQIEHKTFIRHDRIPGAPILLIIKKLGIRKKEILKNCNVSLNRIYYSSFSRNFAKKLINEILSYPNKESVKEEIEYVQWMLDSNQEFVKIEKVETIENTEPVYDIELEPCKFFIGGNKPMNVFDTIRKFTKIPWTPIQLVSMNTLSPEMLAYFWILLQYKSSILISGGTASGKTTLLNALAFFIPPEARVVSIEDTREINLPRENWLPAVARTAIGVGKVGEVDLFDILKSSFRQTPDYLIVGEVRGKEAFVLFQGMASGHASISTMHADSVDTLIRRLQTPPIELSPTLVNSLDCVAIMTHALVDKKETRRLREVVEIVNVNRDGTALINTPLLWDPFTDVFYFKKLSKVFEKISARRGVPLEKLQGEFATRTKLLFEMYKRKIFEFEEVQRIINEYYKNPIDVLNRFNITE
jgi:type IV secretory pathway ATPase VirB11/archaellum biosynthesis ATPase